MEFLITLSAQYLYLVVLSAGAYILFRAKKRKELFLFAIITLGISYLFAKFLGNIIQSPRPFILEHTTPLIPTATDNGFPSDHTLLAMTVALYIFSINKKIGTVLIILAILIGIARVMTKSHHLLDIIGSIGISLLAVIIVVNLKRYTKKRKWV